MSFVRYKIGQQEQFVQFDQYFNLYNNLFDNVVKYAGYKFEEGNVDNPLIKISIYPPSNLSQWDQKWVINVSEPVIVFSKRKNNKIYAYFYCIANICLIDLFTCLFKIVVLNMMLQNKNLLYLHGMLLNNGDVIFASCIGGKSTLTYRINNNNQNLKVICDDGLLIDMEKNIVFPFDYIWDGEQDPFVRQVVKIDNPIKLKNLFLLKQSEQQEIIEIDKKEWLDNCYDNSILFYYHPFNIRGDKRRIARKWIDFRSQLFEEVKNDTKQKMKFFQRFKPLMITTNTPDISKKFEVLSDVN